MNEQELRALVREAIAVHLQGAGPMAPAPTFSADRARQHASHAMFVLPAGFDTDGPCLIEPGVLCNHCGYCKSLGH
jgi:hypothetical protein